MRRWNGWGDEATVYPLHDSARRFLAEKVGPGTPPADATLEQIVSDVPPSRLQGRPLISHDAAARVRHAAGQSLPDWIALRSGRLPALPDGVAYPHSGDEVRDLLRLAAHTDAAVIPYGGGTSVVGHINPLRGDRPVLTVDLSRLNALISLNPESRLATFGAGVAGPDLEAALNAKGFTLGHFPQSFELSTLGGWIATRSAGQQALGYGRIERLFAGCRMEAPAGTLIVPSFPASAAGPDLREFVLGSEGRAGIITEATVRISALPEMEVFHAFFFASFEEGVAAARAIVQSGARLSMIRLSTAEETEITLALAGHERLIGLLERFLAVRGVGHHRCMLLLGFTGERSMVDASRRRAFFLARASGGVHVGQVFGKEWLKSRFRTPYLRNTLWESGYAIDTVETATSWDAIHGMVAAVNAALDHALDGEGERVHAFTHLSHLYPYGSSIYTTFLFRIAGDPNVTLARWRRLKASVSQAIVNNGGTISHQHGVGTDHAPYLAGEKGALGLSTLRALFAQFDPSETMNPGKLLP